MTARLHAAMAATLWVAGLPMACRKAEPPKAQAPAAPPPTVAKAIAELNEDPAWIAGTWKKDGEPRWLLFNLPAEVAELAGNPPRVLRRGKLSMHGRYVSAIFDDGSYELEATSDHSQLSGTAGRFRRGSPP